MALGTMTPAHRQLIPPTSTAHPKVQGIAVDTERHLFFIHYTTAQLQSYNYDDSGVFAPLVAATPVVGTYGHDLEIDTVNQLLFACSKSVVKVYAYNDSGVLTYKTSTWLSDKWRACAVDVENRILIVGAGSYGLYAFKYSADGTALNNISSYATAMDAGGCAWDYSRRIIFSGQHDPGSNQRGIKSFKCDTSGNLAYTGSWVLSAAGSYWFFADCDTIAVDEEWRLMFGMGRYGIAVCSYDDDGIMTPTWIGGMSSAYGITVDTINKLIFHSEGNYVRSKSYDSSGNLSAPISNYSIYNTTSRAYVFAIDLNKHFLFYGGAIPNGSVSPAKYCSLDSISYEAPFISSGPNLFISQRTEKHVVKVINSTTKLYNSHFGTFGITQIDDTGFNFPKLIAADGSNNIYICDMNNKRIVKLSSSLAYVSSLDISTEIGKPHGIVFDSSSGDLYVTGVKNNLTISIARIPTTLASVTKYNSNIYSASGGKPNGISLDFTASFLLISGMDDLIKVEETGSFGTAVPQVIAGEENSKFNGHIKHSNGNLYMNVIKQGTKGSLISRVKSGYENTGDSIKISRSACLASEGLNNDILIYDNANYIVKRYDENLNFVENVFEDTGVSVNTDCKHVTGLLELNII